MRVPLTLLCLVLSPLSALAEASPGIVAVRGYGEVEIPVAKAELSLLVFTTAGDLAKLADKHAERTAKAEAVIASFKDQGIELDESQLQTGDNGEYCTKPSCVNSADRYYDRTTYHLTVHSIAALNAAVTKFAQSGVLRLEAAAFDVTDRHAAQNAARRAAVLDAKNKVAAYADALQVALGDVREITDPEVEPVMPQAMALTASAEKAARTSDNGHELKITPPKTISFTHSVNVTWWLQPSQKP